MFEVLISSGWEQLPQAQVTDIGGGAYEVSVPGWLVPVSVSFWDNESFRLNGKDVVQALGKNFTFHGVGQGVLTLVVRV